MNNQLSEIDNWLVAEQNINTPALLEPIFDPDRALVYSKLGFFKRIFLRPKQFIKRFYHDIYSLPIEHWLINEQITLYDGFCTIDATLDICFQATLNYALNNNNVLAEINQHIKNTYHTVIINSLNAELAKLSDGVWIYKGVTDIENKISYAIGEMLIMQAIQSRTLCTIKPTFAEFPDVQLAQKNVYLSVLKKNFETNQEKKQELYRQEQDTQKQYYQHQQALLEQSKQAAELEYLKLQEQEKQLQEQFNIKKRIHAEKIKHEIALKEMQLEAEIIAKQKRNELLRIAEEKEQDALLQHQTKLQEKKLAANIAYYEQQQTQWLAAKTKIRVLKQNTESQT